MSQVIQDAIDKKRELEGLINDVFNAVNEVLSWVPGIFSDLIEPIKRGVEKLREKVNEFWRKFNEFSERAGSPDKIKEMATQWADAVAYPIGDISGTLALDRLKSHVEWEGRNAEAYKSTIPGQVDGLTAMKNLGIQMRDSLNSLVNAIENFWTTIRGILIGLGIAAVAAGIGAASVAGTPAAIGVFAGAVGTAVGAVFMAVDAAESTMNTIAEQQTAILDKMRDLGDRWSKTDTAAMSDKSDWEIE